MDRVSGIGDQGSGLGAQASRLPLSRACRELEEVFLRYLVREMRVGVVRPEVGPTGGSGAGIYDALIEEGMASALADSGQLGLARMLESAVSGYPIPQTRIPTPEAR